tara:strand:+ start:395 stop:496 length:102 start_codon:yes stop_codon:yes gene_type:complete
MVVLLTSVVAVVVLAKLETLMGLDMVVMVYSQV